MLKCSTLIDKYRIIVYSLRKALVDEGRCKRLTDQLLACNSIKTNPDQNKVSGKLGEFTKSFKDLSGSFW